MVAKNRKVLILSLLALWQFLNSAAFAKTVIYQPAFSIPEIEQEHGPFYTDSLLGLVLQGGNTIDNTVAFNTINSYVLPSEILMVGGHYNYGWDESGLSSRNWDARFRYERIVREHFKPFAALVYEGDPFAGFTERTNFDLGAVFSFEGMFFTWDIDAGYRYTEEKPTYDPERYQNKLRFHLEGKWKVGKSGEVRTWARYMPFLSDTQGDLPNYMFDYGVSINSYFTEKFYLNLSYIGNFREVPLENRKQNDYKLIGSVGFKI